MSADNYVVVKRFGKNDYRWAMGCASNPKERLDFDKHGSFKSPKEAAQDAIEYCDGIIEYGIQYHDNCLRED